MPTIKTLHAALAAELDQAGFRSGIGVSPVHPGVSPADQGCGNPDCGCGTDYAGEQFVSSPPFPRLPLVKSGLAAMLLGCDLGLLMDRIITFQRKTFPAQTLAGKLAHLVKEAQELRDCHGLDREEWADVLLLLLGAADLEGLTLTDLLEAAHAKLTINESREWLPADSDGCYHHKK